MTTINFKDLVDDLNARAGIRNIDIAYQFSNGRTFIRNETPYAWTDDANAVFPYEFTEDGFELA